MQGDEVAHDRLRRDDGAVDRVQQPLIGPHVVRHLVLPDPVAQRLLWEPERRDQSDPIVQG